MAMSDKKDKLMPMLDKLGVLKKMKKDDLELSGKPLMKRIMQTWLPANIALMEMIVYHLPSPARVCGRAWGEEWHVRNIHEGGFTSCSG